MIPYLKTTPAQRKLTQEFDEPAPVIGIDGTKPLHSMPPGVAIYLYNMTPAEYGNRTRPGYRVWAQNIAGNEVKSVLPFLGQIGDLSTSRLFAVTKQGIFNVTTQGTDNPTAVVTFADQTDEAGFCSFLHYTDPSGLQVMMVADSRNGMYEYNPVGEVWTKFTTEVTGADPTKVAFLMVHKGRLWLIERDSADAWYLPLGAKQGAATKFQFGSKMAHGGFLVALAKWTIDGGDGIDDYLLAMSRGGDLLAYRGTDPALADKWNLVGSWFVGVPPSGRRVFKEVGSDTLILSVYGLTSVKALLQGIDPTRIETNVTGNIARLVREDMRTKRDLDYWEVQNLTEEGLVLVNTPKAANENFIQYALNLNRVSEEYNGGWGLWRSLPAITFDSFNGSTFFGTTDGTVYRLEGSLDGLDINGEGGAPVEFSMLTRFSNMGAPGLYKQMQFMRPRFVTTNLINVACLVVYDFNLIEPAIAPLPPSVEGATWDVSIWDNALWAGFTSASEICGGEGYGEHMAVAIKGSATERATFIGVSGTWEPWQSFL